MIANSALVNTVSASTAAYLALLRTNGRGRQPHRAWDVRESPRKQTMIDNETWPVVGCKLDSRQQLFTDAGVLFVSDDQPGTEILARILTYDPKTGATELAVKSLPVGAKGNVIIDFTWLVERAFKWLQTNGSKISNPFLHAPRSAAAIPFNPSGPALSAEQTKATETLLRNPVAYVWGPPGTGKTRHVLAETVTHLMGEGKRVLVTASTNLAVDNALDAILTINRSRQTEILRVGVPTNEFSKKWPDSCEERALKNKLADLEEQENRLTRRIRAPERINQLREMLPKQETRAEELRSGITKAEFRVAAIDEEVLKLDARASVLSHESSTIESQYQKFREERAALQYPEIKQGVEALEREHMGLIATKQQVEEDLRKLGILSRMFSKKPARLKEHLEAQTTRLAQVETTLGSQREVLSKIAEQDARLESEIASMDRRLGDVMDEKDWVVQSLATKRKESDEIHTRLATCRADLESLSVDLSKLQLEYEELENLGPPPGDQELSDLQNQLADVRQRKLRISQNLSEKSVIGTTLDGFIGLTMNQAMQFDHVIVDEAGYAPLAKVIPLLLMHCPISLLGDHKQLPPVYEGKNDSLSESYWGTSALYLEESFTAGVGDDQDRMVETAKTDPRFEQLKRCTLTRSYRFGDSLAKLLDRHFYRMGLASVAAQGTTIQCVCCDTKDSNGITGWASPSEACAIAKEVEDWLKNEKMDEVSIAILAPYKAQVRRIRMELNRLRRDPNFHRIEVMTVHKSQGREWDTVFFSAVDGTCTGYEPFLANSNHPKGALVLNTAISRAKSHLCFFIDGPFWKNRKPSSLLTVI